MSRQTCTKYRMEISAEKAKRMTNSANETQRKIKVKGQNHGTGTITSLKCLGAFVSDGGPKPEILSMAAEATTAITKLKLI